MNGSIFDYLLLPMSLFGITAIEAMGLQLILGGAGLLTLGSTAFFAIGGYSAGYFAIRLVPLIGISHPGFIILGGFIFAMLLSSFTAFLVAHPCLKLRGDYLAVATMGFGQIVENIFNNIQELGGASGLTNIPHPISSISTLVLIWAVVIGVGIFLTRFYKTGVGYSILCSRDDEITAQCFGIFPHQAKMVAFVLGSLIAGLAGALYVFTFQFISPVSAGISKSIEILLAVVIGGGLLVSRSVFGSLLGASILVLIPEFLRFLPQHFSEILETAVAKEIMSPRFSHIIIEFFQNSTLLFSLLVLLILRKKNQIKISRVAV